MSGGYMMEGGLKPWGHMLITINIKGGKNGISQATAAKFNQKMAELKNELGPKMIAVAVECMVTPPQFRQGDD